MEADSSFAIETRGVHQFDLYYFSPIIETSSGFGFAFIGDVGNYIPFSGKKTNVSLDKDISNPAKR